MSPLWITTTKKILRKGKNAKLPSPNLKESLLGPAQDPNLIFFGKQSKLNNVINDFIKGISLPILRDRMLTGSMTVEAALVLPLFLFFFLNLGSIMEIYRLHGRVETALWSVGSEMCIYGSFPDTGGSDGARAVNDPKAGNILDKIGSIALSKTYVSLRMTDYLGKDYFDHAPIRGGSKGLEFWGSEILGQKDHIQIAVSYPVKPLYGIMGFSGSRLRNVYYGRLWTGYELTGEKEKVYYLAQEGEVFHTNRSCSYLHVTVVGIPSHELENARTEKGERYLPCRYCCGRIMPLQLWITPRGECYHTRQTCTRLKRNFHAIDWEEAKNYRPCSRCKKGDS